MGIKEILVKTSPPHSERSERISKKSVEIAGFPNEIRSGYIPAPR
jgi:hypothetical protein